MISSRLVATHFAWLSCSALLVYLYQPLYTCTVESGLKKGVQSKLFLLIIWCPTFDWVPMPERVLLKFLNIDMMGFSYIHDDLVPMQRTQKFSLSNSVTFLSEGVVLRF